MNELGTEDICLEKENIKNTSEDSGNETLSSGVPSLDGSGLWAENLPYGIFGDPFRLSARVTKHMAKVRAVPTSHCFPVTLKEIEGSVDDIKKHVLKTRGKDSSIYPLPLKTSLFKEQNDVMQNIQLLTATENGLVYLSRTMAVTLNIKECRSNIPGELICDIFIVGENYPPMILTITKGNLESDSLKNTRIYNAKVKKGIVKSIRMFTDENINVIHGCLSEKEASSYKVFQQRLNDFREAASISAIPDSIDMNPVKCSSVCNAFIHATASTRAVFYDTETLGVLTKKQFEVISETLDQRDRSLIRHRPSSGASTLLMDLGDRLEVAGKTLLICRKTSDANNARKMFTHNDGDSNLDVLEYEDFIRRKESGINYNSYKSILFESSTYEELEVPGTDVRVWCTIPETVRRAPPKLSFLMASMEMCTSFSPSKQLKLMHGSDYESNKVTRSNSTSSSSSEEEMDYDGVDNEIIYKRHDHQSEPLLSNAMTTTLLQWSPVVKMKTDQEKNSTAGDHFSLFLVNNPHLFTGVDSTFEEARRLQLNTGYHRQHIPTRAERCALRLLERYGCVFIKGQSGSGKSWLGKRILICLSVQTQRTPIILRSSKDFELWIKNRDSKKKYAVIVDDIFGTSCFLQAKMSNWRVLFGEIWGLVESRNIYLVLTSRTDIAAQCIQDMKKYTILNYIPAIVLDEGDYRLTVDEKLRMVKTLFGKLSHLTNEDLSLMANTDTSLGFPQCCALFIRNNRFQSLKHAFFKTPLLHLAADIDMLRVQDEMTYLSMLVVAIKGGTLNIATFSKTSFELMNTAEKLKDLCLSSETTLTLSEIKSAIVNQFGGYLVLDGNIMTFQHPSIFECVMVNAMKQNQNLILENCHSSVLNELLICSCNHLEVTQFPFWKDKNMEVDLCNTLTKVLLSEDCADIIEHPCLQGDTFVHMLASTWCHEVVSILTDKQVNRSTVEVYVHAVDNSDMDDSNISHTLRKNIIFEYTFLTSYLIINGLSLLSELILFHKNCLVTSQRRIDEALTCAVYKENWYLAKQLLAAGATPSNASVAAFSSVQNPDTDVQKTVFEFVLTSTDITSNQDHLFVLAIHHENLSLLQKLTEVYNSDHGVSVFSTCLLQLLCQNSQRQAYSTQRFNSSSGINVEEIILLLLDKGCLYNHTTALCLAAEHSTASALKILLNVLKADNTKSVDITAPLCRALEYGSTDCVNILLDTSNFAQTAITDNHLLHLAAKSMLDSHKKLQTLTEYYNVHFYKNKESGLEEDSMSTKQLVSLEVVNRKDSHGNTPLHYVTAKGDVVCTQLLLRCGADVNVANAKGCTPIDCAAASNNIECLVLTADSKSIACGNPLYHLFDLNLHDVGVNLQCSRLLNVDDDTKQRNLSILVQRGADVNRKDDKGKTCLFHVVYTGNFEITKQVLESGAHIHTKDYQERTPLFAAAENGDTDILRLLLENGALLHGADNSGKSILHVAGRQGDLETVRFLCSRGAEVNARDDNGETVLHAAAGSHLDALGKVQYLLEQKHAVLQGDSRGRTPLFPAVQSGNDAVIDYLVKRGLRVTECDQNGVSLLHAACSHRQTHVVPFLYSLHSQT